MTLLRADLHVLSIMLGNMCPKLSRCFREQNIELTSICSEWYITWFAKCLPLPSIMRVWDALFFEGYKVLLRVALGVFKRVEAQVLSHPTFEEIMKARSSGLGNSFSTMNCLRQASPLVAYESPYVGGRFGSFGKTLCAPLNSRMRFTELDGKLL